jgi:thiol-disulfide isomerase/thioredoxin
MRTEKMNSRRVFLLAALSALALPAAAASAQALDIRLDGMDGKPHALTDYIGQGKWVALNIWGPRCPPCAQEMPDLQRFHDKHAATRAMVLGVALDFPSFGMAKREQVAQFLDDYFISFPVLLTDGRTAARIAGNRLEGTPTTLLFRPDGSLAARHTGTITEKLLSDFIASQPDTAAP